LIIFLTVSFLLIHFILILKIFLCKIISTDQGKTIQITMMFYRMVEKVTTLQICKKAFSSHKPINEFNKSNENMIPLIEDKEYHNLASEKVKYQTNKIKIMEQPILKLKFLLL